MLLLFIGFYTVGPPMYRIPPGFRIINLDTVGSQCTVYPRVILCYNNMYKLVPKIVRYSGSPYVPFTIDFGILKIDTVGTPMYHVPPSNMVDLLAN